MRLFNAPLNRKNFFIAITAVWLLNAMGCSAYQARQELHKFQRTLTPELAKAIFKQDDKEYRDLCVREINICSPKLFISFNKNSGYGWKLRQLPSYQKVTDIHVENLRKAIGDLPLYVEAGVFLSRALAEKVDRGDITQEQYKFAFDKAVLDMKTRLNNEFSKLQQNILMAENTDAETWRTIGEVVITVVKVAIIAAVVAYPSTDQGVVQHMQQYPGNCQYSWQFAIDGSVCGGRSASSRPGGW